MTSPAFLIALGVHVISLVVALGSVLVVDTCGLLWLFRRMSLSLVVQIARVTQRLIWIGWVGLVASGVVLLQVKGAIDGLTWVKLFLVTLAGINGILLHVFVRRLELSAFAGKRVRPRDYWHAGFLTFVSLVSWWGAATIGFLHNHWRHWIEWPSQPSLVILMTCLVFLGVGVAGELAFVLRSGDE